MGYVPFTCVMHTNDIYINMYLFSNKTVSTQDYKNKIWIHMLKLIKSEHLSSALTCFERESEMSIS